MAHSGVPGISQVAQLLSPSLPTPAAPPPPPSPGAQTQAEEEKLDQQKGQGQAANMLFSDNTPVQSSRAILLGA